MKRGVRAGIAIFLAMTAFAVARTALAQSDGGMVYRSVGGLDSRTIVWFVAELHLMFAAFVLGVPIFAVIVELVGKSTGDARYDRLAHELTRLLSAAFSTTAALGGTLAFVLIGLYPTFMTELGGALHKTFYVYAALFFAEAFCLYMYYYGWDRMQNLRTNAPRLKRPAWAATALLGTALVAAMLFVPGNTEEPVEIGLENAARIGAVAEGLDEFVELDAKQDRIGEQTRVARWSKRAAKRLDELEGLADDEGYLLYDPDLLPETVAMVETMAVETLQNAPKNAPPEQLIAMFKTKVAEGQANAKLAGHGEADDVSRSRWSLIGLVALAFLVALGVACWSSSTKTFHLYLGLVLNLIGITLMMIANSWTSFMMSPTGYSEATFEFGGSTWGAVTNPLWQPLNLHRLLANIVFGGFVAGAYAAVKFLSAKTDAERAHYDWMGYIGNFVGILAMIPLPFAGYLLGREIYSYSPIMGNNMMGGAFSWAFIFQAVLIGVLFIGANYYLWIGMERIPGAERYRKFIPWYAVVLLLCFAVWVTPHNLPLSGEERALMGGVQYHPVLKYLGLMPAKNAVVNLIILTTFFCFLMYRRGNRGELRPFSEQGRGAKILLAGALLAIVALLGWYASEILQIDVEEMLPSDPDAAEKGWVLSGAATALFIQIGVGVAAAVLTFLNRGKLGQAIYFASTAILVVGYLGVWGFVTMQHVNPFLRNIAVCQVLLVVSAMILCGVIDVILLRGSKSVGAIRWGKIPERSQYTLLIITVAVVQLMALMGFIRSALREDWHLYGVLRDTSEGAGTPTLARMGWVAGFITIVFFALVAFVFWLGGLSEKRNNAAEEPEPEPEPEPESRSRSESDSGGDSS